MKKRSSQFSQLWTFHLCLYKLLCDIPELVVPIIISMIEVATNKDTTEPMVPSG